KGHLKITCWIEGDLRCFSIEDNGCGISDEKLKEIQSKKSNSIGITNVDSRIKLVYGNEYGIEIESVIGEGTRISIVLPLYS
ncbi:MAG: sensor histidine kinase, partial [Vallitaleaceae bacterium]|nr:sensor histidine kinase [Vallitaleaceae bacterium]